MSVRAFLVSHKVLWPLFAGVGTAIGGGAFMLYHTAVNCPDVTVNKHTSGSPWNSVAQHQSPKLFNAFPEFFEARKGMPQPHQAYLDEDTAKLAEGNYLAEAKTYRYYRPKGDTEFAKH